MNKRGKNQKAKAKRRFTVAVVTGTRAEFGIWRPVLNKILASNVLRLKLIVTGMHLQKEFGNTIEDVAAGYKIAATAEMYRAGASPEKSLSLGVASLGAAYRKTRPDVVMVLGDRLEMLAAASAALACRIATAHVHGGETAPGIWDEQIRHAISKMAQLHFCSTRIAARRIIQMGEDPACVHQVGAPALDQLFDYLEGLRREGEKNPAAHVPDGKRRQTRGNPHQTGPLLLLHPTSGDDATEYHRARMLIALLRKHFPHEVVWVIGPNNDPGHRGILRACREAGKRIFFESSQPQDFFWVSLSFQRMLIGNSSSGIIEAASFGIPVINIGDRQKGRERNPNVIDAPWSRAAIERAIHKALTDKSFLKAAARRQNLYGDGHASERIVAVLERIARTGLSLAKTFHDLVF